MDLFCGAGGLSAGLVKAGWRVIGAADWWVPAVRSYALNFSHPVARLDLASADVRSITGAFDLPPSPLDLVVGGPPCQGFSVQRIGPDADSRNDLVLAFAELVVGLRPRMFLMENVPGLLGSRGRATATRFERVLHLAGYDLDKTLVNAADYGVPQNRRRVFFIGWLAGQLPAFRFPSPTSSPTARRTVAESLGALPSPPADFSASPTDPLHRRTKLSPVNLVRLGRIPPGGGFEDLPVELRVAAHKRGAATIGHRYVYGRLDPTKPAATITARFDSFTRGKFGHPFEDRNITLREGARLQTFDDSFRFEGTQEEIAALIGNAVPPLLAEVIGRALLSHTATDVNLPTEPRPRQLPLLEAP
ncbi:MAG: DNA cytosine methyltransferase [Candidatus Dormibacteria bacterium]